MKKQAEVPNGGDSGDAALLWWEDRRARVVLLAGTAMLVSAAVASAAPPFPDGATATPLVGSVIVANCATTPARVGGRATLGGVTVGDPAGGSCTTRSAAADGLYSNVAGPLSLRFFADCDSGTGATSGGVEVAAGAGWGAFCPPAGES